MDATASLAGKHAELARIERQLQKLLEALLDDGDSKTIVKNMQALEARQEALEAELSEADSPPPLLHPNMVEVYHRKINELHQALTSDDTKTEAAEILRTLIDAIVLTPEDSELSIYLKGDLAGILTLAQNKTKPLAKVAKGPDHLAQQVSLVAGTQHSLCTFCHQRFAWYGNLLMGGQASDREASCEVMSSPRTETRSLF